MEYLELLKSKVESEYEARGEAIGSGFIESREQSWLLRGTQNAR